MRKFLLLFFMLASLAVRAQFSGDFAPSKWTFASTTSEGDGSVIVAGAPNSIVIYGSDNGRESYIQNAAESYFITVPYSGTISFSYKLDSPDIEDAYYFVNLAETYVTHNGIGTVGNVTVKAGDIFGFKLYNYDNCCGRGVLTISNFSFKPDITLQPVDAAACSGSSASFIVGASEVTSYQWQILGNSWLNVVDAGVYSGATSNKLQISDVVGLQGKQYRCIVNTQAKSNIISNVVSLTVNSVPSIVSQPISVSNYAGQSASLTVSATSAGNPIYQWKKDGTVIDGATGATLNISSLSSSDVGSYTVDISNACGTITSSAALVVLKSVPVAGYLNGLQFDGVNDYVEIPSQPSNQFDSETEFTVSLWFKANSMATAGLFNRPSGGGDMQFWLTADNGKFTYGIDKHGYGWTWIGTETAYKIGEWVQVTTVRRNVNGQRRMEIYANGVLVGSGTVNYTSSASNAPIRIGTYINADGGFANGQIDNVSLWRRALTEEEIKTLGATTLNGNETGLAGYWRFDETSGDIAYDATANANHGKLINMDLATARVASTAGDIKTFENVAYSGKLAGSDPDGRPLSYSLVSAPSNGTIVLNANGTFTYTPATNVVGTDVFSYIVSNGTDVSNTATVNVTIVAVNKAPVPAVAELPTITAECDVTVTAPTANDDNDGVITGVTTDPVHYATQGNYTITWTYRDSEGLTSTQTQQVIIKDVTKPVFAAVTSINQNNDADKCGAVVTYPMPTATDNCGASPDPNAVYTLKAGDSFYDHVNKRLEFQSSPGLPITFSPTDGSKMAVFLVTGGTSARLSQDITLPSSGSVELSFDLQYNNHNGSFDSNNQFMAVEIRNPDTDDLLRTILKTEPGAAASIPMTSYKFDISEFSGQTIKLVLTNTNIQHFFFDILLDNVKVPGSTLVNGSFETGDYTGWTITESGFGTWGIGSKPTSPITIVQTAGLASGSLFPVGTTTNSFTATDAAGNTSTISFDVTVTDTQKPTVLTKNITVELDATGAATITLAQINNGSTDNCSIPADGYSLDKTSFSCTDLGPKTVTLTVTDANGNSQSATATVTVVDRIKPTITAPVAVIVNTDAGKNTASGVVLGTPTSADNCSVASVTNNAPAIFPLGITTVTWTVTDAAGNTAEATQEVTVEDKEAPVPSIATLPAITGQCAATVTAAPTATDNVSGMVSATTTALLSYTAQGTYTITWTYTDASGNTSTQSQQVIVKDDTAPVVKTRNITVELDATGNVTITADQINDNSTDNCGIASLVLDKTDFDCSNQGANTVRLTVTDVNGNSATATAVVKVVDNIAPVAVAQDVTLYLSAEGTVSLTPEQVNNNSSENCALASLSLDKTAFDCSNIGKNTVTLTVRDASGNQSTATATVTVLDNMAPIVRTRNITVQLDAQGKAAITAAQINNGSSDNCGIETISLDKTTFDCSQTGANTVTLTVTDKNGNTASATATVTVQESIPPVVLVQDITVALDENGIATITADQIDKGSSDNCGIESITLDKTSFDCSNVGKNTVTLTVTDKSGNKSSATAIVTVEDKIAPTAIAQNITVYLDANGQVSITAAQLNDGSSDNCGEITFSLDKTSFGCEDLGENTVTLTVTDKSGNQSTATATVTVEDKVAPVVITQNITVQLDASGTAAITVADVNKGSSDNCSIATMSLSKTTFDCSNLGTNEVVLTVTDGSGNVATGIAIVTVEDKLAPIAVVKNITVQLNAAGKATITAADLDNGSSDNCGIAGMELDKADFDCSDLGENQVTLTVTDASGNKATAVATVSVEDKVAPMITAPAAVVVNVDPGKITASNVALGEPATSDNCSVALVTNDAPAEFPTGTTTVTWTVTDASGNTTTATQTVTVRRDVVSVASPAQINVPIRTAYASLPLPATVTVTYSDGATEAIKVVWAQGTYNGLVAGTYTLSGQLTLTAGTTNLRGKVAEVTVKVEPNKVPTALAFSATTFKPDATAADVIGTLTTADPDDTEFVYTLVSGAGDKHNSLFEIRGDQVYLKSNNGLSGMTSFTIRVRSTDPYQNTIERTFTLTKQDYDRTVDQLKIVNAFSPNGDGINDNWTIPELRFYNQVYIQVFDRSGVRVFETTDPEKGWDGRGPNGQVLKGAFLYTVEVKDINWVKRGVVTILSK